MHVGKKRLNGVNNKSTFVKRLQSATSTDSSNLTDSQKPMSTDENQVLVLQLRETSQNLVIATLCAKDLQAKAESISPDVHPQLPKLHASFLGVAVSVKDNGIGIGIVLDVPLYIFDLFTQGGSQGGLSIRLSVVRSMLEMHGGSVKVHSAGAGQDSEFIVWLPISDATFSHDSSRPQATNVTSPCPILLIEDNVDLNQTLNDMLALDDCPSMMRGPTIYPQRIVLTWQSQI